MKTILTLMLMITPATSQPIDSTVLEIVLAEDVKKKKKKGKQLVGKGKKKKKGFFSKVFGSK